MSRMRNSSGEDRLSNLPNEILRHILSLISMKDAGKVGTLSKMWRRIWYSTPNLLFDYDKFLGRLNGLENFRRIIDQTHGLHDESDIEKFKVKFHIHELEDQTTINNQWIEFALSHNVQKLSLYGRFDELTQFPTCLYTCKSLTKLDLALAGLVFILPPNVYLPNLNKLDLKFVTFTEQSFTEDICLSCPVLENLSFCNCDVASLRVFLIFASKLKHLTLDGCLGVDNCVVDLRAPSLSALCILSGIAKDYILDIPTSTLDYASANCEIQDFIAIPSIEELCQPLFKIMQGIFMGKHLSFNPGTTEALAHACDHALALWSLHSSITFCNVKKLELDLWPMLLQTQMTILILHRCQNLADLDIFMQRPEGENFQMHNMDLNLENINFVLKKLCRVLINNLKAEECEMELVKFLLSNAPKLVIRKIVKELSEGIRSEVNLVTNSLEEYRMATFGDHKVLLSLTSF